MKSDSKTLFGSFGTILPEIERQNTSTRSWWDGCLCLSLSEMITDSQIGSGQLKADQKDMVMYTLLRKHKHQTKKSNLRSLADIGKSVSSASRLFSHQENGNTALSHTLSLSTSLVCSHFHLLPLICLSALSLCLLSHVTRGCIRTSHRLFLLQPCG